MLRLFLIFIAFIINTTITYLWTIEGTWPNLLFKSLSLSMIIVFMFYYIRFVIENKKKTEEIKIKSIFWINLFNNNSTLFMNQINHIDKMINRAIDQIYNLHF